MELYVKRRGEMLRRGFTTGTCAAAAAKAAAIELAEGERVSKISVDLPSGERVTMKVRGVRSEGERAFCCVVKDAGDDPDVTNGAEVWAEVELQSERGIVILGGDGVGIATKPGLKVKVGEAAINPIPRAMIAGEVASVLAPGKGAVVKISVPHGGELARRTLNSRLGIVGGISILGTTGIVEPKSVEALRDSLVGQIDVALALGYREVVLTPGRRSEKMAVERGIPQDAVAQTSNFVGFMLDACASRGAKRVLLFGGLGKLSKLALGHFYTHSGDSPSGIEAMARHALKAGAEEDIVSRVRNANTTEDALSILMENGLTSALDSLAEEVSSEAMEHVGGRLEVGTALISMEGIVVGRCNLGGSGWERYLL